MQVRGPPEKSENESEMKIPPEILQTNERADFQYRTQET